MFLLNFRQRLLDFLRLRMRFPAIRLRDPLLMRELISYEALHGNGLEIGALHMPLRLSPRATAKYIDRYDVEGLRAHYPEMRRKRLTPIDIIDDGETLEKIGPESQDFLIANHFLEHTQNPIATLQRFLEVVRPGGLLFIAIPDKRGTFDIKRPVTPLKHLYRDYEEGPDWSRRQHLREYAEYVLGASGDGIDEMADHLIAIDYSIHYHVWTHPDVGHFLHDIRSHLQLPFDVESLVFNAPMSESICLLRRR